MASVVMIFFFADSVMAFPGPVLVDAIPAIAAALVAAYTNSFFLLGSRASTSWLAPLVAKTTDMPGYTTLACFSFRVCFAWCAAVWRDARRQEGPNQSVLDRDPARVLLTCSSKKTSST